MISSWYQFKERSIFDVVVLQSVNLFPASFYDSSSVFVPQDDTLVAGSLRLDVLYGSMTIITYDDNTVRVESSGFRIGLCEVIFPK